VAQAVESPAAGGGRAVRGRQELVPARRGDTGRARRLWELRDEDGRRLTREAYERIGGVGGALGQHAEATLETIGRERLPLVREIFRNLVTAQATRAVREHEELLSVFENPGSTPPPRRGKLRRRGGLTPSRKTMADRDTAAEVLDALVAARLLTSFEEEGEEGPRRVEIVHESLLSEWPRLVRWQTQDADAARMRDQLRQAAQLWQARGRPPELLWSGTPYRELRVWQES
jgi:hypothetical protein